MHSKTSPSQQEQLEDEINAIREAVGAWEGYVSQESLTGLARQLFVTRSRCELLEMLKSKLASEHIHEV